MISNTLGRIMYWMVWPVVWIHVRNSRRAKVIIVCNKEVLLVKNRISRNNNWTLPGGGTKGSEADKVCAARELREEIGIITDPISLRELGEYTNKSAGYSYTVALFALGCDKNRKIKKGPELSELKWFPAKELPKNRNPIVDEAIKRIKQG